MRKLFALIGDPVSHSRSPAVHARAFSLLGVDAVYAPLQVAAADLHIAVAGLRAVGVAGWNVTVPHKTAMAALCDSLSREAELAGATNCVVRENNRLIGYNTDGIGLLEALRNGGVAIDGARALVLGAGGAAKAAAMALAGRAAEVNVLNRDPAKARLLSLQLRAAGAKSRAAALGADERATMLREADLIVQCSSVGMGKDEAIVGAHELNEKAALCDLVYVGPKDAPLGDTTLLAASRARGLRVVDGLSVLVHQAVKSLELWLRRPDLGALAPELRAAAIAETFAVSEEKKA